MRRIIIDQEAAKAFKGDELRREWLLEARRLRELGQKYFARAMGEEGDVNAAVILIKASDRLATLTGMNVPIGHWLSIMQAAPVQQSIDPIERGVRIVQQMALLDLDPSRPAGRPTKTNGH